MQRLVYHIASVDCFQIDYSLPSDDLVIDQLVLVSVVLILVVEVLNPYRFILEFLIDTTGINACVVLWLIQLEIPDTRSVAADVLILDTADSLQWLSYQVPTTHSLRRPYYFVLLINVPAVSGIQRNVVVLSGNCLVDCLYHFYCLDSSIHFLMGVITLTAVQVIVIRDQGVVLHELSAGKHNPSLGNHMALVEETL